MKTLPICCPCDYKSKLKKDHNVYVCKRSNCPHNDTENAFFETNGKPILISEKLTDTVCNLNQYKSYVDRSFKKFHKLKTILQGESKVTKDNCSRFLKLVKEKNKYPKILVIGGAEKGASTSELWESEQLEIHSIDIYQTETVDIICDAHYLPLMTNSYDGVWIQAVLEHVVEPQKVVNEIYRVLKSDGIIYAETPFMQQVHEGSYDFTRFTVLGHRYLFKKFEAIEFGGNKGPELVLAWSIRYFLWALTRSRFIARLIGIAATFLLLPFSLFISKKALFDASSGVFFLGRKKIGFTISHKELVTLYDGMFRN
jgi:SAM-dependent methyltransferase